MKRLEPFLLSFGSFAGSCLAWLLFWLSWRELRGDSAAVALAALGLSTAALSLSAAFGLAAMWARKKRRPITWAALVLIGPLAWLVIWSLKLEENAEETISEASSDVVFLSTYKASSAAIDKVRELALKRFPGILLCQAVEDSEGASVIAYWTHQGAHEASRAVLERELGLGGMAGAHFVRESAYHRKRLWQRLTPYSIVIHSVAFIGGLAALEKYHAWLFEPPNLTAELRPLAVSGSLPGPPRIDVLRGRSARIELFLLNHSRTEFAQVMDIQYNLNNQPIKSTASLPPPIKPGESRGAILEVDDSDPGEYELKVNVRTKGGRLRFSRVFSTSKQVRFWSPHPVAMANYSGGDSLQAVFEGKLSVGTTAPKGLHCQITVSSASVDIANLRFPGVRTFPDAQESRTGATEIQVFDTPALEGLRDYMFDIVLSATEEVDWSALADKIRIKCVDVR